MSRKVSSPPLNPRDLTQGDTLGRKQFDLHTLFELANQLTAAIDPEPALTTIVFTAMAYFGSLGSVLYVSDPTRKRLLPMVIKGFGQDDWPMIDLQDKKWQSFLEQGKSPLPYALTEVERVGVLKSLEWVVPLKGRSGPVGLLLLGRRFAPGPVPEDIPAVLETLGAFASTIVERDRLLSQLRQSEKLSALGEFVAGVAHELNNPLGAVAAYCELIEKKSRDCSPQVAKDIASIKTQVQRALFIVKDLLTFAGQRPLDRSWQALDEIIQKAMAHVDFEFQAQGIEAQVKSGEGGIRAYVDRFAMEQVIVNLLKNAADAIGPKEGKTNRGRVEVTCRIHGGQVEIMVRDNGCGIPQAHLANIFNPFFTTKPVGRGTGLGLSICHSLVAQHGGGLRCESEEGQGTVFIIGLPYGQGEAT